ncbi:MAG TPA: integration host factor subunit beta [Phycisphaerales bacterium]|nr:integration host factor subunit beta [Phycisphaerales bacterium]
MATKNVSRTVTKKELIDRVTSITGDKRVVVQRAVQTFLNEIINDLGEGNRLEFRDFGVFEVHVRKARIAQNPKTLEPVEVPAKGAVKFKPGRLMRLATEHNDAVVADGVIAELKPAGKNTSVSR